MSTTPEARRRRGATRRGAQRGLTLIELIISLVLAGIVLGTIWSAWALLARNSVEPSVARQSLAIAQSLLREIELQPLPGTAVAASSPGRTGLASIADYNGLTMNGIVDAEGTAVPGLSGYSATVHVTAQALAGVDSGFWVEVDVTGPGGQALSLAQWRGVR